MQFQRLMAPITGLFQKNKPHASSSSSLGGKNDDLLIEEGVPPDHHVYGFAPGPQPMSLLISAGNPATGEGAVFIRSPEGEISKIALPDETALLTHIVKTPQGTYVAGGMSSIGRGVILLGDASATTWTSANVDLHPFSAISSLVRLTDGTLLAFTGHMMTQGKTKPVLFRSKDEGVTWEKEVLSLPISTVQSCALAKDGSLYVGTSGDKDPKAYVTRDQGQSWIELPLFPGYKTYKMISIFLKDESTPNETLFVVLWGYKTEIADRVVRIYALSKAGQAWEELPPIANSHFIFSFLSASDGSFYVGSEKGCVFRSTDSGKTWKKRWAFSTNIGAQALYEDSQGTLWLGKDAIPPAEFGLWRATPHV